MQSLGIGILASALVAVLYGLFVAQREEQIRRYLKHAHGGLLRRLYVLALTQAVRGDAAVADSRHLAVLVVALILVAGVGTMDWVNGIERDLSDLSGMIERDLSGMEELRQGILRRATPESPADFEEVDQQLEIEIHELFKWHDSLKKRLDSLKAEFRWILPVVRSLSVALIGVGIAGWFAWMPYVLLRRRFSHEIARFSLRIQGLATQEELATLTKSELAVRNPSSLQAYVGKMKQIAGRHGMPELTKTFELWEPHPEKG